MNRTALGPALLVIVSLLVPASTLSAENWPQWRGPNNDGISNEKGLPTEFGPGKNQAWKLDLPGVGSSTPCIWDDRIFLSSVEGQKVVLLCISTQGKELWRVDLGQRARREGRPGGEGDSASPSPSTDGKAVYVFTAAGEFAAFDIAGKPLWRFNAQERYGRFQIQFGLHSTPVLYKDRLYMQLIHSGGGQVVCIDKATGKDIWKVKRQSDGTDENEHSYASAFLWSNGKDAYLVCHGNDYATAHHLEDGKEIWRLADLNPSPERPYNRFLRFVASPVCTPDLIVVPTAKRGTLVAIKPDAQGLVKAGSKYEQWRHSKGTPDVPCPLVHDGRVYICDENGALTCRDAKSGKEIYTKQPTGGRHRASPVHADGKIHVISRSGIVRVFNASDGKLLATNKMGDDVNSSIAVSGGRIYVRSFKSLWAFSAQAAPSGR